MLLRLLCLVVCGGTVSAGAAGAAGAARLWSPRGLPGTATDALLHRHTLPQTINSNFQSTLIKTRRRRSFKSKIKKLNVERFFFWNKNKNTGKPTNRTTTTTTLPPTMPVQGWVRWSGAVPSRAFHTDETDGFGRRLYPGRVFIPRTGFFDNVTLPGYYREGEDCLNVNFDGAGHCVPRFELLVGRMVWQDQSQKHSKHPDSVTVGMEGKEMLAMCKSWLGNHTIIGKVPASRYCYGSKNFGNPTWFSGYKILLFVTK